MWVKLNHKTIVSGFQPIHSVLPIRSVPFYRYRVLPLFSRFFIFSLFLTCRLNSNWEPTDANPFWRFAAGRMSLLNRDSWYHETLKKHKVYSKLMVLLLYPVIQSNSNYSGKREYILIQRISAIQENSTICRNSSQDLSSLI